MDEFKGLVRRICTDPGTLGLLESARILSMAAVRNHSTRIAAIFADDVADLAQLAGAATATEPQLRDLKLLHMLAVGTAEADAERARHMPTDLEILSLIHI